MLDGAVSCLKLLTDDCMKEDSCVIVIIMFEYTVYNYDGSINITKITIQIYKQFQTKKLLTKFLNEDFDMFL